MSPDGDALARSSALWNRTELDLRSLEILAQILDRGDIRDWRALYRRARHDAELRARIHEVVLTVPLPYPRLWLAALAGLGEHVDLGAVVPTYPQGV